MIEIQECELVDDVVGNAPIFEVTATNDSGEFQCRIEILLTGSDLNLDEDVEFEHLSGVEIGPDSEEWEDLVHEVTQTQAYKEAIEDHQGFEEPILE